MSRAGAPGPDRVLVLRCAGWPEPGQEPDEEAGPAARAFEPVVAAVGEFCPKVEILRPGTCAIGVRGPARYFGGEAVLAEKVATAVRRAGFACRAGVADGLFAAELAARTMPPSPDGPAGLIVPRGDTPAFLAGQPVRVLGRPELEYLLPRLGIATLGELARLPAGEAASRFGAAGALAHRLARGLDPRPLVPRPPAAEESVSFVFEPPAEQAEPVVFTAKSLAESLHAGLAARGLACVRVQVLVRCQDGREITRFWRHDGLLSELAVAERVRWQLDAWRAGQDEASGGDKDGGDEGGGDEGGGDEGGGDEGGGDQGSGITLLRLVPDQLVRATGRQLGLWGDAVVTDRVARAAIRVQAMLGHGAVTRPVLAGGRRPGDQVLLVPFGDAGTPARPADRPWPGKIPAPAPATVYPVPLPATVTDAGGAVVSVTGRAQLSAPPARLTVAGQGPARAITAWAGPWPVTERWWDPAHARRQARFQLVAEDGQAWLAVVQEGRWMLEASYD